MTEHLKFHREGERVNSREIFVYKTIGGGHCFG